MTLVHIAEQAAGGNKTASFEMLKSLFPGWQTLQEDSRLVKILNSAPFKSESGEINTTWLILYGLMLCEGTSTEKAEILWTIVQ